MSIYISKNNQQTGPFDETKVLEMLRSGQLSPNDLAIRQGGNQWQKLGEMFPSASGQAFGAAAAGATGTAGAAAAAVQNQPASQSAPKKSRKGLLLGCGGFLVVMVLVAGILGFFAYRNLFPADSKENLPDTVKNFKLNNRYPPKGNIWGTEANFMGIYSDATQSSKSVIYMMTVYNSETAAKDALRSGLASSCRSGETPMNFSFVKNGAEVSQGATCAAPLYVQKDNKLVALGGSADVDALIEFAENLPFNGGAEMKKK